ncbi:helix-turn-helix domain-containing protein [Sphingomonas soli]|uniref:helix-turn-helix domain-containing protein n=1 Tax=Sphingomonas soli TaxID=266127 RepID=UPI00147021AB|nr:helix-turn-helix domain-containing protein [Sphingomonas soli]
MTNIPGGTGTAQPASSSNIQAVSRAFAVLEALNRRAWSTIGQLHQDTGLPKPTLVRMLHTLIQSGYAAKDPRQNGYCVTVRVQSLSCGFHGDPLVVEAARPGAIALTRDLHWPSGVAILDGDAVRIRFSTIYDSSNSPFHATLNMRLSLFSSALGMAYYAFCPESERRMLRKMVGDTEDALLKGREKGWLEWRVQRAREQGYAERDPGTEPRNSGTIAVPIMKGDRVAATIGLTFFRRGVQEDDTVRYVAALRRTALAIEHQMASFEAVGAS